MNVSMNVRHFISLWPLLLLLSKGSSTLAQVVPDSTLGSESSQLQLQGNQVTIEGGANRGFALFHSFDQFNVADGQQVFFANPQGINTILSRVTGSTPSNIDGILGVLGSADLFLLNPNGILFGPNAKLDLSGSFTASTADSFQVGDINFSATDPASVPLLSVNVVPGIQVGANAPGRLIQNRADLNLAPQQHLSFNSDTIEQAGQITIPGGTVDLRGRTLRLTGAVNTRTVDNQFGLLLLSAPTDLNIEATAPLTNQAVSQALADNKVLVESDRNLTVIGALSSTSPAPLTLTAGNNLQLLPSGDSVSQLAGNVTLQSGRNMRIANQLHVISQQPKPRMTIQAEGNILLRNLPLTQDDTIRMLLLQGDNGRLSIQANSLTNQLENNSDALVIQIVTVAGEGRRGPDIDIALAQDLALQNASINTRAINNGTRSGSIRIDAGGSVNLLESNIAAFNLPSDTNTAPTGTIDIQAGDTILLKSGFIFTQSLGNTGDITLGASRILIDSTTPSSIASVFTNTNFLGPGNAGNVTINTSDLFKIVGGNPDLFAGFNPQDSSLPDFADQILNNTFTSTVGATALGFGESGTIEVNANRLVLRDGVGIGNASGVVGDARLSGDVLVNAQDLQMRGLAVIGSTTLGTADAGDVRINSDRIHLLDGARISSSSLLGIGSAGTLTIDTNELVIEGGSAISTETDGGGQGGLLDIRARSVIITGTLVSNDFRFPSALITDTAPNSTGGGGELRLQTETLQVLDGGQIRASSRSSEAAGDISISADRVTIDGVSPDGLPSTIEAQAFSTGDAGNLLLAAEQLTVRDGAFITTQSQQGSGGNIQLALDDVLSLRRQGTISATAGIAGTGGDGGNIDINAGFVVAPTAENSDITANAFDGRGGNIQVQTNALLGTDFRDRLTPLSDITASSEVGLAGVVTIQQVADPLNPEPIQLPGNLVSADDRLTAGCLLDEDANFVATGRGGIPADPGEQLNQGLLWDDPRTTTSSDIETTDQNESTPSALLAFIEAQEWRMNNQGQIELIAVTDNVVSRPNTSC